MADEPDDPVEPTPRIAMVAGMPQVGIPEPRGALKALPPAWFKPAIRKTQGFTTAQIARDLDLKPKTVSSYIERAKLKLGCGTVQELELLVLAEYAKDLMPYPWDEVEDGEDA